MSNVNEALTHGMLVTRSGRYALLAMLLVDIFLIPPLVSTGVLPAWAGVVSFSLMVVTAMIALASHVTARWIVFAVAAISVVGRWTPLASNLRVFQLVEAATVGLAAATFAGVLLVDVFSKGKLPDRLLAVLLVYLLLGTTWSFAYALADLALPGALEIPGRAPSMSEFVYFSFSTLTTVGYGDIVPVHPMARSLAVLEALVGQLYLVVIVSRFVGEGIAGVRGDGAGENPSRR